MPSLQLLQLTKHGRNLLSSRKRTLAIVSGALLAGGTLVYAQSGRRQKHQPENSHSDANAQTRNNQSICQNGVNGKLDWPKWIKLSSWLDNNSCSTYCSWPQNSKSSRSTIYQTSKYLTGSLGLCFKKILTDLVHADYFENMVYYKISHVDHRISNPEQRIASDIPKFCAELSGLVQDDLAAVADGLIYIWRLCSYASPKYVLWILAYVLGAGGAIRKISPAFGKLKSMEQQLEGEYRQVHSRLRTHAESVAFYGGENREASHIMQRFQALVRHLNVVLHENWWFGMIQDFLLKYLGATVGVILIIEPFFAGNLKPESSTLGRAEMLSNLRYHTSVIISLFQSLGTLSISSRRLNLLSGYADRIRELMDVSRELSGVRDIPMSQNSSVGNYISEANYIEFSGVKVVTPSGNVLVDDLTLRVESGSNLLITGPNGSGKSSLFRVLGGLWPLVSGHIVKPADQETEPLSYGGMVDLLKNVDLEYLLERYPLDKEVNWGDELSLGEQQRLGMARLFYHKPKFAILDECTSAVTTDMEERFCKRVRAMGTSCITISHRPALVAFHDIVLSLDGEGGWKVQDNRNGPFLSTEPEFDALNSSETYRKSDALAVQRAFIANTKDNALLGPKDNSYSTQLIAASPDMEIEYTKRAELVPQLQCSPRPLPVRAVAMAKILVPKLFDKQGGQLFAVALLVFSRTWISDRIASLNGTSVKYVLEQDKAAFLRLIGISVLQSAANSVVSPSLRNLTSKISLGWRIRLTNHLLQYYLKRNAFYKVFNMSGVNIDADQRMTHDVEKLTNDLAGLVTGMVKPLVDILWFTWRMKILSGRRGVAILYAYMLLGLGFLRTVSPNFGDLANQEQELEGTFRFMHSRLRTHAESIAFFGGGSREKAMVEAKFTALLSHSRILLRKRWLYGIFDDFVTKQLPHNVTWGLSMLYALEHKGDRALTSTQGELAHALRFLASVVSQSFIAFGDILELHKKFLELSGGINRVFELEELLQTSQSNAVMPSNSIGAASKEIISFHDVDIVTPSQKLLATQLSCDVSQGKSLLVTGPNGSGKSSIFRVLRGLWPIASGRLAMPSEGIFHVPQRPYTCLGTLRDQIIYPLSREEAELKMLSLYKPSDKSIASGSLDDHLKTILENVRLVYLLEREGWDATPNWEDILSLGEQQRLGMARLFFHCPKFGILDECTNATSVDVEEHLYKLATSMGITVVTSSQRPALIPFHSLELKLIDAQQRYQQKPCGPTQRLPPPRRLAATNNPLNLAVVMFRLRSSARLLRELREASRSYGRREWLSGGAASAAHTTSLLRPLPGLFIPTCLPDQLEPHPTRITTLPNGVRVASEDVPGPSACVGVFVDSGSVYETTESAGVTHLLEKLAFKDTAHRSHLKIVQDVEATGGNIGASAAREQMVYSYDTLKTYLPQAIEVLIDCVRNPLFLQDEVERQLALAQEEVQELQNNPEKFLQESLNLVGYRGALANPLVAPEENLTRISGDIIRKFYHGSPVRRPESTYIGGDFRHRADSEMTHVALAFEVPGGWLTERDAAIMTVIQTLMGGGGSFSSGGPGKGMHSRLYLRVLAKYHAVQTFSAFSNVYDNTGLFGIYLTTPSDFVPKAVDVAIKELIAVATPGEVTDIELTRAKNSTISAVLMNLESRVIVAEDIGRQLLTYGCRKPVDHFLQCLDEMSLDDITAFAQKILSSQPTMASWGDVDKVPPYEFVSKRF
ncbi:hypothetical protein GUJ93_ZPchr0007g5315 [Zizania palustris]|uniref:Uncharacterized protein n=1 Tax=Zizania palustris TaxID=103762 RepID=A0A8J5W4P9_ZIZPA|nr:hypothetical protein GUJ93_ZPchr0007g5315 [Zizania palustris]